MTTAPDRILAGGPVVTVTAGVAEAVAVSGDRISAVGARDDILASRGPDTEIVGLRGSALLPGLVEPHTHPEVAAQLYSWVDVSGFSYPHVADVERALAKAISKAAAGEWVFAFGLDPMLTPDLGTWNRDRLDRMAPDNPVVVMIQSMHTVFANSAALAAAGVTEDTPDPGGRGHFLRDANGRLTGAAVEQPAVNAFVRRYPQSADLLRARQGPRATATAARAHRLIHAAQDRRQCRAPHQPARGHAHVPDRAVVTRADRGYRPHSRRRPAGH